MRIRFPKSAHKDEKTINVPSSEQPQYVGGDHPQKTAASFEDVQPADDSKTLFVKPPEQSIHGETRSEPFRRSPSPRLTWPARDRQTSLQSNQASTDSPLGDDEATRLFRPADLTEWQTVTKGSTPDQIVAEVLTKEESISDRPAEDPVVGWLVIVQGPGKGRSLEIGVGANSIGRDTGQKICLAFGDDEIHRDRHAVLVYEPRSRRFFLQSGDARNLTYISEDVVLSPVELKGGETITLGKTQLRFVSFCGPQFSWS